MENLDELVIKVRNYEPLRFDPDEFVPDAEQNVDLLPYVARVLELRERAKEAEKLYKVARAGHYDLGVYDEETYFYAKEVEGSLKNELAAREIALGRIFMMWVLQEILRKSDTETPPVCEVRHPPCGSRVTNLAGLKLLCRQVDHTTSEEIFDRKELVRQLAALVKESERISDIFETRKITNFHSSYTTRGKDGRRVCHDMSHNARYEL